MRPLSPPHRARPRPALRLDRITVNDVHSRLNRTDTAGVAAPASLESLHAILSDPRSAALPIAIAGGRHAMGGQQFRTAGLLIDMLKLHRVLSFDRQLGHIEVESGIRWPELIAFLHEQQRGESDPWAIAQKQTGADRLTLGGALSANIHGRGLMMKPFISDIESFTLIDAYGAIRRCSRRENRELFSLAIGGYGLFGVIYSITLRLVRRTRVRRVVRLIDVDGLNAAFDQRIAEGCLYGDFQFAIDAKCDSFLKRGVFSCYQPVAANTPLAARRSLSREDWLQLLELAHTDKQRAFACYSAHYEASDGQVYDSDTHQLTTYIDDYHAILDRRMGAGCRGSEMITELYVPHARLQEFLAAARDELRSRAANVIYGTIRRIERDDESYLPWARERFSCVIFNLHVDHNTAAIAEAKGAFRALIDAAIACGGSFYLTYHRFADRAQVEIAYPRLSEFLRRKRHYDPTERFASDWYAHYRAGTPVTRRR